MDKLISKPTKGAHFIGYKSRLNRTTGGHGCAMLGHSNSQEDDCEPSHVWGIALYLYDVLTPTNTIIVLLPVAAVCESLRFMGCTVSQEIDELISERARTKESLSSRNQRLWATPQDIPSQTLLVLLEIRKTMTTPIPGALLLAFKARQLVGINKPARLYRSICK
jgi:hypothetical protein